MSTPNVNVLVVDDDMAVCRIVQRMLADDRYTIQICQSVANALSAIEQKLFDVYVMDYKLPDGTGLDVAERIRSKKSDAPIILISGYDASAVALRAEKLHISDIIEKPFSRETICNAVRKAIGFSPNGDQPNPEVATQGTTGPVDSALAKSAAAKKRFPKAALIGAAIFLVLVACVAVYLLTQGHSL
jgi:DNA-binding NtrC family response regulator